MTISYPTNTKEIIDEIRGVIGRDTVWYILSDSEECPTCGVDPITDTAIDAFCPTCSGAGYIYTYSGVSISGHVSWGYSERLGWVTGGQLDLGDCRVQIEYTPENITVVDASKWVVVDGKELQIKNRILRGFKELNRILVDLIQDERDDR